MGLKSMVPELLKDLIGRPLGLRGVSGTRQWQRIVMNREIDSWINAAGPTGLSAVEISGNERAHHSWSSFTRLDYPTFDLCAEIVDIPRRFDVVVCEQVLEHVPAPWLALERLRELASPGGYIIVSTPFLIRVHAGPGDYWRFTEDGLRVMIERAGLEVVESGSWGNRRCIRANMHRWARYRPWSSLKNDRRFPVAVWVIAQRPA